MNYDLFKTCVQFLELKKPVQFKIIPFGMGVNSAECRAVFTTKNKLKKTVLVFWLESMNCSNYDFNTVMVHELIHSWQWERGLLHNNKKDHCRKFKQKARELQAVINILHPDIALGKLYDKNTDDN